jgi:drug/metabolite transporter (DMT)-like permease
MNKKLSTEFYTILFAITMLSFGSVGAFAIQTGIDSKSLVFLRCVLGLGFLLATKLWQHQFQNAQSNQCGESIGIVSSVRRSFRIEVILAGIFLAANWFCFFEAIKMIPVTVGVTVYYTAPLFVVLGGLIFYREKVNLAGWISIVICFLGSVLLSGVGLDAANVPVKGILFALAAAILYAAVSVVGRNAQANDVVLDTCVKFFCGAIVFSLLVNFESVFAMSNQQWLWAGAVGVFHTGVLYLLFFKSLPHLSSQKIALFLYLDPLAAILIDVVVTGFRPSLLQMCGIVLVFGAIVFRQLAGRPNESL